MAEEILDKIGKDIKHPKRKGTFERQSSFRADRSDLLSMNADLEEDDENLIRVNEDDCIFLWIGNGDFGRLQAQHGGFIDLTSHL